MTRNTLPSRPAVLYVFGSPASKLGLLSMSLNWAYFQDRSIWQIQTPKIAPLHFWLLYEVRNIQILTGNGNKPRNGFPSQINKVRKSSITLLLLGPP